MCHKNGTKAFYVLFKSISSKPVQLFSKENHVYKSLEVYNRFPNPNEVIQVMKNNSIDDIYSVKIIKIDIPFNKLF